MTTLPTETDFTSIRIPFSVGERGGCVPISVAVLDSDKCRNMRWCARCGGPQQFVEVFEIAGVGRAGFCFGCGEEKVLRFERVSE